MNKIKAIISDADGTLVDTLHLIRHGQYETVKEYLLEYGIPAEEIISYQDYEVHLHKALGGSARETLERTVRLIYKDSPDSLVKMDFDALHDLLNPIQDKIAPEYVKAYPGLSNLLLHMGKEKINLAVFTSGTPHHIVRNFGIALDELGKGQLYLDPNYSDLEKLRMFEQAMQEYFGIPMVTFVTCNDVSASKPDPESILVALKRLNLSKEQVLILGDHWVDMQAGTNANIPLRVAISHGFDSRNDLEKAGATRIIDSLGSVSELLGHIA